MSQQVCAVDVFYRSQAGGPWEIHTHTDPDGSFALQSLGIALRLADVYQLVPGVGRVV
ncbi:MAG: hypothetical protein OHK0039_33460 [Bacteroidia bacterium]